MKQKLLLLGFIFILLIPNISYGQQELYTKESPINWMLKVSPFEMINGDYSIMLERHVSGMFSVEAGIGIIAPYYIQEMPDALWAYFLDDFDSWFEYSNRNIDDDIKSGTSWRVGTKFTIGDKMEGFFVRAFVRQRNYNFSTWDAKIILRDYTLGSGAIVKINDHLFYEWYASIGFRERATIENSTYDSSGIVGVIAPIGVRFCYGF